MVSMFDKKGYFQEWSGFYVEGCFIGIGVYLCFQDMLNCWCVMLDGGDGGWIDLVCFGVIDVWIDGLVFGEYLIWVEKISEFLMFVSFGGVFIDDSVSFLFVLEFVVWLIEFIGDLDMVGFVNGVISCDCIEEEIFVVIDILVSFGLQVVVVLGVDYWVIVCLGIGFLCNYGGVLFEIMMFSCYFLVLLSDLYVVGQLQCFVDIVVMGLGLNDFGLDFVLGEVWCDQVVFSCDFVLVLMEFLCVCVWENLQVLQVLLVFGEYGDVLVGFYCQVEVVLKFDGVCVVLVVLLKLQCSVCFWYFLVQDYCMIVCDIIYVIEGVGV